MPGIGDAEAVVARRRRRGHAALRHVEGDRRECRLVAEVAQLPTRFLELELDVGQTLLDRQRFADGSRPVEEAQELRLDGLEMARPGLQVDDLC